MKIKRLLFIIPILCFFLLISCDIVGLNGKKEINFKIEASANIYYIDKTTSIEFSLAEDAYLGKENYEFVDGKRTPIPRVIEYYIVGENLVEAVITDNVLVASKIGTVEVQAKCDDLTSNIIKIAIANSEEYIADKLNNVLYENNEGVVLGQVYDVGITAEIVDNFEIEGADGLLQFNSDGSLEVIGIGYGRIKIINHETGNVIYDNPYNTFASIFARKIRECLINEGIIVSIGDIVTRDMFPLIKELDLSGELINDKSASIGIKYLTNLEKLNLSDNNLDNLDFLSTITTLKEIDLSYNQISNLDAVIGNEELEILNLSNNKISELSKLQYLHKIKKLDLSNNELTSINALSSSYSLESLFVNYNQLNEYIECLSNLEYLKELGVGHCNITFTDIKSLKYLSDLTYLDLSGTSPDISLISGLNKLETLILESCKLNEVDITPLNTLTRLETLDISNNNFDPASYNNAFINTSLVNLKTLKIGGNSFSIMPDFSVFPSLKTLDLTDSYNLNNLDSLSALNITELILDGCNSIDLSQGNDSYISVIESMPYLSKLSIVDGFNYINKELYEYLLTKVNLGELSLRFLDGKYANRDTIYNFNKAVFFDMDSFLKTTQINEDVGSISALFYFCGRAGGIGFTIIVYRCPPNTQLSVCTFQLFV